MDAVVDRLVAGARRGRKALVFTRRVASVDELVQRVNDRLDADMLVYVRQQLPGLGADVDRLVELYESYRSGAGRSASRDDAVTITEQDLDVADDESPEGADEAERDVAEVTEEVRGGKSLFEWLFRQPSKDGVLTGWALR